MRPLITVIVPTCHRPDLLSQCLVHLTRSITASGRADIEVVVSDDSTDSGTKALVSEQYPWARWVQGPRRGPAHNRNFGAAQSTGEWILFIDDDCIPSEGWIVGFLESIHATPGVEVFEGRTTGDRERYRMDEEAPINTQGGVLWACNMAVTRTLFERLGGFCELFPYAAHEDADFRLRLNKAGERFAFVSDAVVCHPFRSAKSLAFQLRAARSYLLLSERHPELLGRMPMCRAGLNFLRRARSMLRLAGHLRFRGFGFALGSLAISTWAEIVAAGAQRRRML
jgi:GT2 family glycosyltransferase